MRNNSDDEAERFGGVWVPLPPEDRERLMRLARDEAENPLELAARLLHDKLRDVEPSRPALN